MREQVADRHAVTRRRGGGAEAVGRVGAGNLTLVLLLGMAGVLLVRDPANDGGPVALALVQLSIWPLLAMRSAPVLAPTAVALGALLTQLVIGPIVTCGVVLPVLFAMVFQVSSRALSAARTTWALLAICAGLTVQVLMDPQLGAGAALFVPAVGTGFFCAGLLLRSRERMVGSLRQRTQQLGEQRERTARLAVEADRARIGADLDLSVRSHLRSIAEAAAAGRAGVGAGTPESALAARRALVEVELRGRETLVDMREVVGALRDAPTQPPPGMADLPGLVDRATGGGAHLLVEGAARRLSSHLELCAYRIVEQLLSAVDHEPRARVEVVVRFEPETLTITVSEAPVAEVDATSASSRRAAVEAASARAQVAGGRLYTSRPDGRRGFAVVLPVPVPASSSSSSS